MKNFFKWLKRKFVYDEFEDVKAFYEKFGQPTREGPGIMTRSRTAERINFMQEELNEFKVGAMKQDVPEMADALIDLVYVAKGTAIEMGLPWEALWQDVQRANMAKVPGMTSRGIVYDVKKPDGWEPPMTEEILKEYGL